MGWVNGTGAAGKWHGMVVGALAGAALAQTQTSAFRLNQLAFPEQAEKRAVVVGAAAQGFSIVPAAGGDPVYSGTSGSVQTYPSADQSGILVEFSEVKAPGQYKIVLADGATSEPFTVGLEPLAALARASIKSYTYNRASQSIPSSWGGKWDRTAGHPDNRVFIHASAATPERPEGTVIASPRGWYDAGDYGKYAVNSGISTYTLLAIYRDFPAAAEWDLNIPESGDALPDLIDEVLWNLRWMLTIQDPGDGGVYHKVTTASFPGTILPQTDTDRRYAVAKSVTATLNLAAVAAAAARILKPLDSQLPGLRDSLVQASLAAWKWARANPTKLYRQNDMNTQFSPAVTTGEYGDGNAADEFFWAGAELYLTTGQDSFLVAGKVTPLPVSLGIPSWSNVSFLGGMSLAAAPAGEIDAALAADVKALVVKLADQIGARRDTQLYHLTLGPTDFFWGSNGNAANHGIIQLRAYAATGDAKYLGGAQDQLDYLLGRNPLDLCFVTGHGRRFPLNPHHRISEADDVREPVPGMLVGGPNSGQQDDCEYASSLPALSYSDTYCSYASNEIAINWNAPLAYLASGLATVHAGGLALRPAPRSGRLNPVGAPPRGMHALPVWSGREWMWTDATGRMFRSDREIPLR